MIGSRQGKGKKYEEEVSKGEDEERTQGEEWGNGEGRKGVSEGRRKPGRTEGRAKERNRAGVRKVDGEDGKEG
jgi:hypothetical protein